MDMLNRFFKNDQNNSGNSGDKGRQWRFKGHAQAPILALDGLNGRAIRKPVRLLGFDDTRFVCPAPHRRKPLGQTRTIRPGFLFEMPAGVSREHDEARRDYARTLRKSGGTRADDQCWSGATKPEGDLLESLLPDLQVKGKTDKRICSEREEVFERRFAEGQNPGFSSNRKSGIWMVQLATL